MVHWWEIYYFSLTIYIGLAGLVIAHGLKKVWDCSISDVMVAAGMPISINRASRLMCSRIT